MCKNIIVPEFARSLIAKLIADDTPVVARLMIGSSFAKVSGRVVGFDASGLEIAGGDCKLSVRLPGATPGDDCEFFFDEKDHLFEETRALGDTALSVRFGADSLLSLLFEY